MANKTVIVIAFLSVFAKQNQARGHDLGRNSRQIAPDTAIKTDLITTDFSEQYFLENSPVSLRCGDQSVVKWDELIYLVWNVSRKDQKCWLGLLQNSTITKLDSTCNDGKSLKNSSDGFSLVIPNVSKKDEGLYQCDLSYKGGGNAKSISLKVIQISTRLENKNGRRFAVCNTTYGKAVTSFHWESVPSVTLHGKLVRNDSLSIVESHVDLPDGVVITRLTCTATFNSEQLQSTFDLRESDSRNIIVFSSALVCCSFVLLAVIYIIVRKLKSLRPVKTSTVSEVKPPPSTDVEEVEPYASYVQRVNSIYNSSAELFNT